MVHTNAYRNVAMTSSAALPVIAASKRAALTVTPVAMARVVVLDRQDVAAATVTIRILRNVVKI
jgi:hypothetical protein